MVVSTGLGFNVRALCSARRLAPSAQSLSLSLCLAVFPMTHGLPWDDKVGEMVGRGGKGGEGARRQPATVSATQTEGEKETLLAHGHCTICLCLFYLYSFGVGLSVCVLLSVGGGSLVRWFVGSLVVSVSLSADNANFLSLVVVLVLMVLLMVLSVKE